MSTTSNFTKRDMINSRNSFALQDLDDGTQLQVEKAAVINRPDLETGEEKEVAILVTTDGTVYSAISATVRDVLDDTIDLIEDEGGAVTVRLNKRKSKAGREFLSLTVL